ncbi:aspartate kinase [Desulfocicer vacuolatum DSM 3385]|uniref:Aspartokinase n=1 Tax=Desulfocicer vacuolatum DSM 3385 TaxID=1121400 RepID=A0A1W2DTP3_9BACT|nr:aspartate kinase [Desulfocicer vacuolatum]SMD00824.1 aspartate kinase [Desulfocicer vacuolatum DSM 3385]
MKVIKIGGGCLKGEAVVSSIVALIIQRGRGNVFVLSALSGITDKLMNGIEIAMADEDNIPSLVDEIRREHLGLARHLIASETDLKALEEEFEPHFLKIERYFFGISFTREATPRMQDIIVSYGERLSVILMAKVLKSHGEDAHYIMPRDAGIITDGRFADATANMPITSKNMQKNVLPMMTERTILFVPGFFGISETGEVTTFGRGGSDYSAAVVAAAMKADILEIWKDTEGFMTADPRNIPEAKLISILSYEEASELAYSGASILHPRTVEPVRKSGINIAIKNTLNPDGPGSLITEQAVHDKNVIKSISHSMDIAVLKVYASGVGLRQGILAHIAGTLAKAGINIKSVVTSQTCISLLLSRKDIERAHRVILEVKPRLFRESEQVTDTALISVVGDGLHNHRGIAARCFTAVSQVDVNIEMISFGPSKAALYFLVHETDLEKTMAALHSQFV